MRKYFIIMIIVLSMSLTSCKEPIQDDIDCNKNPEHESCEKLPPEVTEKTINGLAKIPLEEEMKETYKVKGYVSDITPDANGTFTLADSSGTIIVSYSTSSSDALKWNKENGIYEYNNPNDFLKNELTSQIVKGTTVELLVVKTSFNGEPRLKAIVEKIENLKEEYNEISLIIIDKFGYFWPSMYPSHVFNSAEEINDLLDQFDFFNIEYVETADTMDWDDYYNNRNGLGSYKISISKTINDENVSVRLYINKDGVVTKVNKQKVEYSNPGAIDYQQIINVLYEFDKDYPEHLKQPVDYGMENLDIVLSKLDPEVLNVAYSLPKTETSINYMVTAEWNPYVIDYLYNEIKKINFVEVLTPENDEGFKNDRVPYIRMVGSERDYEIKFLFTHNGYVYMQYLEKEYNPYTESYKRVIKYQFKSDNKVSNLEFFEKFIGGGNRQYWDNPLVTEYIDASIVEEYTQQSIIHTYISNLADVTSYYTEGTKISGKVIEYFGAYNEGWSEFHIAIIETSDMDIKDEPHTEVIDGIEFKYQNSNRIYCFETVEGGEAYTLQTAFDKGLLTHEDLQAISENLKEEYKGISSISISEFGTGISHKFSGALEVNKILDQFDFLNIEYVETVGEMDWDDYYNNRNGLGSLQIRVNGNDDKTQRYLLNKKGVVAKLGENTEYSKENSIDFKELKTVLYDNHKNIPDYLKGTLSCTMEDLDYVLNKIDSEVLNVAHSIAIPVSLSFVMAAEWNPYVIDYLYNEIKKINFVEVLTPENDEGLMYEHNPKIILSHSGDGSCEYSIKFIFTYNGYVYMQYLETTEENPSGVVKYQFKSDNKVSNLEFFEKFIGGGNRQYWDDPLVTEYIDASIVEEYTQQSIIHAYISNLADVTSYYTEGDKISGKIIEYFGTYNEEFPELHIAIIETSDMDIKDEPHTEVIAGVEFKYQNSNQIYCFETAELGEAYTLQTAFDKGLLTHEDLVEIAGKLNK